MGDAARPRPSFPFLPPSAWSDLWHASRLALPAGPIRSTTPTAAATTLLLSARAGGALPRRASQVRPGPCSSHLQPPDHWQRCCKASGSRDGMLVASARSVTTLTHHSAVRVSIHTAKSVEIVLSECFFAVLGCKQQPRPHALIITSRSVKWPLAQSLLGRETSCQSLRPYRVPARSPAAVCTQHPSLLYR